jgi:tRNA threonylcarbamoyladenosine biosynthesis protein TsaE
MNDMKAVGPAWPLPDEKATAALATHVAGALDGGGMVIYLHGPLGAGKTSFARALLAACGVGERIKSPTYSLVEAYTADRQSAWHLDLYRIADPGELEWLGLEVLADPQALVLVEWPERGVGALPVADIELDLAYAEIGRVARLDARTARGERLLLQLAPARS